MVEKFNKFIIILFVLLMLMNLVSLMHNQEDGNYTVCGWRYCWEDSRLVEGEDGNMWNVDTDIGDEDYVMLEVDGDGNVNRIWKFMWARE